MIRQRYISEFACFLIVGTLFCCLFSSIPVRASEAGGDLFPLKSGNWWTYRVTDGKGKSESIKCTVVSAKPGKNGSIIYRVDVVGSQEVKAKVYSKQGGRTLLERLELAGPPPVSKDFVPAKLVVDSKVKTDSVWQWGGTRSDPDVDTERWQVFPVEKVKVPAGVFNCVRIGGLSIRGSQLTYQTRWFAPNIGIVKALDAKNSVRSIQELTGFHIN